MTDIEFIKFLVQLLWNDMSDGDTPEPEDWDRINTELRRRGIDPDELMGY